MSEAAEATVEATEAESPVESQAFDSEPEDMPNFNIYSDEAEVEAVAEENAPDQERPKDAKKEAWSAKIKKDRAQRKREIELKRREQEISAKEQAILSQDELRKQFINDPEKFLQDQGIDPIDFYSDWTTRLATGSNKPGEDLRISETERELKALREELKKRDQARAQERIEEKRQVQIDKFYSEIEGYMGTTDASNYPLTVEQCSAQDIAQGIAAYYQQTGVELSFKEAFEKVESGLREKENNIFNDPAVIAKFKKYHNLDASNNRGRRSQVTLSSNLQTQPTKTPAEDMTDDEIHEFWKGKLFT